MQLLGIKDLLQQFLVEQLQLLVVVILLQQLKKLDLMKKYRMFQLVAEFL